MSDSRTLSWTVAENAEVIAGMVASPLTLDVEGQTRRVKKASHVLVVDVLRLFSVRAHSFKECALPTYIHGSAPHSTHSAAAELIVFKKFATAKLIVFLSYLRNVLPNRKRLFKQHLSEQVHKCPRQIPT